MTSDAAAAKISNLAAAPSVLPAGVRTRILVYLGVLLVLLGFGSPAGGLIGLPISFLLKNKLHLKAHEMAIFGLVAGVPTYVSFLFGFARDTWNPFGMRDRGFMVLFGGLCAAGCSAAIWMRSGGDQDEMRVPRRHHDCRGGIVAQEVAGVF